MEAKVAALSNIFPEVRMGTIIKVLNENNWQQEAAVEVLLQMAADEERKDDANDNNNDNESTPSVSIPQVTPSNPVDADLNENQNQPNRTEGIALVNPPLTTTLPQQQQQQQQQNTNTNDNVYLNNNNNNNNASWEPMQILQDLRNYITRSEAWALSIDVLTDLKREITAGLNELMSMVKEGGLGAEEKRAKLENRLRELQEINRRYEEERASKLNTTTTQNPPSNNNSAPCNVTLFVQPTPNQSPVVNNVNTNTQPQPQSQPQSSPRVVPLQDFTANFAHFGFTPAYPPANYPQHNMYPSYPPVHIAQQQAYYQPQQQPQQSPRQQQQQQQHQQPNLGGYPQPYYPYPYYYTQPRK